MANEIPIVPIGGLGLSLGATKGSDYYPAVDITDTTQNPTGSTKRYAVANLDQYVFLQLGVNAHTAAVAATTANLVNTYNNGTAGVGATLTNNSTQVAFVVDGYTASVGDRILVKNQTLPAQNGIYTVTNTGSASTNWVLTRATDANTSANLLNGDTVLVTLGSTNANKTYQVSFSGSISFGTTALTWTLYALPSVTYPISIANGGTSVTSVTTAPTATAFAGWDANSNLSANNFLGGYATTVTAAATTTLVVGSAQQQYFTGSTTQTVVLPVTSTLVLGQSYYIVNNSSGVVTVQSSGANTIKAMAANSALLVTCILTSGTTAASWNFEYALQSPSSGITNDGLNAAGQFVITDSTTGAISTTSNSWDSTNHNLILAGAGAFTSTTNAVAIGFSATSNAATVTGSVIIGGSASAWSTGQVAIGLSAACGTNSNAAANSTAIGHSASATNSQSTSIGYNSTASGNSSLALGESSLSNAQSSISIGAAAAGVASNAIAIGSSATASGTSSICIGQSSGVTTGTGGIAIGISSSSQANYAVAIGRAATAKHAGAMVLADSQNNAISDSATDQWLGSFTGGYYNYVGTTLATQIDTNFNLINLKGTADQSYSRQVPITGFSITIAAGVKTLMLVPAGTLATGTITMPAAPIDGQEIRVNSTQAITALTVSPNAGQTITNPPTSLAAGNGFSYIYNLANTVWNAVINPSALSYPLSNGGNVTKSLVNAYLTPTLTAVTGDGTDVAIVMTALTDRNGDFSHATGQFTAPVTGSYQINLGVDFNIGASGTNTYYYVTLRRTGSSTTTVFLKQDSCAAVIGNGIIETYSIVLTLTAGDTIAPYLKVSGNASKNVNIFDSTGYGDTNVMGIFLIA